MKNCLLCGVGGQGTVLAAKILAEAAIQKGEEVKTTETIGMAQRGGSVVSHVRMGEKIHSPLIPEKSADVIIGFEPAEVVRNLSYLSEHGVIVVSRKAVKPVTATLTGSTYDGTEMIAYLSEKVEQIHVVDTDAICEECGTPKVMNIALLGAAVASGNLGVTLEEVKKAMKTRLPEKLYQMNEKALLLGADRGMKA